MENQKSVLSETNLTPLLVFTSKKIDKLLESESKNDDAFPLAQFCSVLLKHCETFTYRNKSFPKEKTNGYNWNLLTLLGAAISKYNDHLSLKAIRGKMLELDNLNFHFRNFHFCLIFGLKIYRVPKAR